MATGSRNSNADNNNLKDYFRRLGSHPDRNGQLRRDAFGRLLNLINTSTTHDSEPENESNKNKILVMEFIQAFFADFPDMQDDAINLVYDMCEDQDQKVRIAGYSAITSVSKVDRPWLVRNADVLVQLLQIDDTNEVSFVKRALQEHVDLDPQGTLRVLVDQCTFNPSTITDPDERDLRTKLRSLVLDFLSQKYKICIARAVRNPTVEKILIDGMVEAIPRMYPEEISSIIKTVLINLPSFSNPPTQRGDALLDALLSSIRTSIHSELSIASSSSSFSSSGYPSDLKRSLPLLNLAILLITPIPPTPSGPGRPHQHQQFAQRHQSSSLSPANPHHLFRGYIPLLTITPGASPQTNTTITNPMHLVDVITPPAFQALLVHLCETIDLSERVSGTNNPNTRIQHSLKDSFIRNAFPLLINGIRKHISSLVKPIQISSARIIRFALEHITKLSALERASLQFLVPDLVALESELKRCRLESSGAMGQGSDEVTSIRKIIDLLGHAQDPSKDKRSVSISGAAAAAAASTTAAVGENSSLPLSSSASTSTSTSTSTVGPKSRPESKRKNTGDDETDTVDTDTMEVDVDEVIQDDSTTTTTVTTQAPRARKRIRSDEPSTSTSAEFTTSVNIDLKGQTNGSTPRPRPRPSLSMSTSLLSRLSGSGSGPGSASTLGSGPGSKRKSKTKVNGEEERASASASASAPVNLMARLGLPISSSSSSSTTTAPKQRSTPTLLRDRLGLGPGGTSTSTALSSSSLLSHGNNNNNSSRGINKAGSGGSRGGGSSSGSGGGGEISIRGAAARETQRNSTGIADAGGVERTSLLDRLQMQTQAQSQSVNGGRKRKLGSYSIS